MKKLVFLLLPICASAQSRQGVIIYERKIDLHRTIQDEQMKAQLPQFQAAPYEVVFRDSIAVYKAVPKDEAPDPFDDPGGGHFVFRFGGPGDGGVSYRNYNSGRLLEETSLAETKYIITDSLHRQQWKLSDETATVLGHVCKKATTTATRGGQVVAWYALDIPLPIGPDQFDGLPGAVLKVDVGEGLIIFTAKEVQDKVDNRDLKAPAGGRLITRADYAKKMDEVLGPPDAQGRRIIRN